MDIDLRNYQKEKARILEDIRNSTFISFDFEFSGLTTIPEGKENEFQDEEEHYQRIRQICCNFGVLQFGLTCFIYKQGHYHPKCYNIFVRNPPKGKKMKNLMVIDCDSMEFLCTTEMDFKRVFQYGVPSRRISEKEVVVEEIKKKLQGRVTYQYQFVSPEDGKKIKQIEEQLLKVAGAQKKEGVIDFQSKFFLNSLSKRFNFTVSKKVEKNFKEFQYSVKVGKNSFAIPCFEDSEAKVIDKARLEELVHQQMGLSELVEEIIKHKIPLVGHFIRLDIGYLYHCYVDELPEKVDIFQQQILKHFPYIFDTKVFSKHIQKQVKGLRVDLQSLAFACSDPNLLGPYNNVVENKASKYHLESCCHEAGYDSYVTGLAFVGMINFLNSKVHNQKETEKEKQKEKDKGREKKREKEREKEEERQKQEIEDMRNSEETDLIEFDVHEQPKFPILNFSTIPSNHVIYSKTGGQVSLQGKIRSNKLDDVLVLDIPLEESQKQIKEVCSILSAYGSLKVFLRDKIYIKFNEKQDTANILKENPKLNLIGYRERKGFVAHEYLKYG